MPGSVAGLVDLDIHDAGHVLDQEPEAFLAVPAGDGRGSGPDGHAGAVADAARSSDSSMSVALGEASVEGRLGEPLVLGCATLGKWDRSPEAC